MARSLLVLGFKRVMAAISIVLARPSQTLARGAAHTLPARESAHTVPASTLLIGDDPGLYPEPMRAFDVLPASPVPSAGVSVDVSVNVVSHVVSCRLTLAGDRFGMGLRYA